MKISLKSNFIWGQNRVILEIGKYYHPYHGGMETVLRDICELFNKEIGLKTHVLCSNTHNKTIKDNISGVKVTRLARHLNIFSQAINFFLYFHLKKHLQHYKVVHFHGPNPLWELMLLLCLPDDTKLIISHHSDIINQKLLRPLVEPIYKLILKRADAIIVPTENHINYSRTLIHYKNKCHIIPFFINEKNLAPPTNEALEMIKRKHSKYALFVGRLVGYKGLEVLIKAAQQIEHEIVIIGSGPLEEPIKELIENLNLTNRIHILGRIKDSDTFSAYYHQCHFLVLPSISPNENFGLVQLEAMFCKKAVLTTNLRSGVPCVGIPGQSTILVTPENVKELSNALFHLFESNNLAKSMGEVGFDIYKKKYQKNTIKNQYLTLIDNI